MRCGTKVSCTPRSAAASRSSPLSGRLWRTRGGAARGGMARPRWRHARPGRRRPASESASRKFPRRDTTRGRRPPPGDGNRAPLPQRFPSKRRPHRCGSARLDRPTCTGGQASFNARSTSNRRVIDPSGDASLPEALSRKICSHPATVSASCGASGADRGWRFRTRAWRPSPGQTTASRSMGCPPVPASSAMFTSIRCPAIRWRCSATRRSRHGLAWGSDQHGHYATVPRAE